jgi:hypothetical protein
MIDYFYYKHRTVFQRVYRVSFRRSYELNVDNNVGLSHIDTKKTKQQFENVYDGLKEITKEEAFLEMI